MTRRRGLRPWLAAAALAALGAALVPLPPRAPALGDGLALRLFGPVAALAASAQWVRADLAFRGGRIELFHARAQLALALAPHSVAGWNYLAWHQAYMLASPEREPDPAQRLAWVRAGLATAAEGERAVARPGELALVRGQILLKCAGLDPDLGWPGGQVGLLEDAARELDRAGSLGFDPEAAAALAGFARAQAAAARAAGKR